MKYYSTNGLNVSISFKEAVIKGLPDDNGLFMPINIPRLDNAFLESLSEKTFHEIAYEIASKFVGDEIPKSDLYKIIHSAFIFSPRQASAVNGNRPAVWSCYRHH